MTAIRTLAAALDAGLPLERALEISAISDHADRKIVSAILEFARHTGAPRATSLGSVADARDFSERCDRAVTTGSATARQTTRILALLPFATAIGAQVFGFDVVTVLVSTPLGWVCLALGAGLSLIAQWWMRRIRESLFRPAVNVGLVMDLAAGVARTSALTPSVLDRLRDLATVWNTTTEIEDVMRSQRLARETGVPIAGLLEVFASTARHRVHVRVLDEIELLPGKLLAPVGACLFPAFVVMTVIPIVASMASSWSR